MIEMDVNKVAEILRNVAATEIMPRFKNLAKGDIREKNPGDFVTIADEAAEIALSNALQELLPQSEVVGEEAVAKDRAVLEKLKTDKPVWVIDPIDGTYNFTQGRSNFGVLVALVQNDEILYSWVYDAPADRMAIAIKGQGVILNGEKVSLPASPENTGDMTGMGGGGQAWHFEPISDYFKEIINVRSALHDFMHLAAGKADFVVHIKQVTPWDHSATVLLAQELGFHVALAGEETPFRPSMYQSCMLIAAPNKEKWQELNDIIYPRLTKKTA